MLLLTYSSRSKPTSSHCATQRMPILLTVPSGKARLFTRLLAITRTAWLWTRLFYLARWQSRLVPVRNSNTAGSTGLCLEVHDLAVSKLVASREKDIAFVGGLFRHKLPRIEVVQERLTASPLDDQRRQLCL